MVKISECVDKEGPPIAIAKVENDESYRMDSGNITPENESEMVTTKDDVTRSSGNKQCLKSVNCN